VAPQRDGIFKQKVSVCVQHNNIAEVHQFPRYSVMEFQNICNEMVAPFFLRHPVEEQEECTPYVEAKLGAMGDAGAPGVVV